MLRCALAVLAAWLASGGPAGGPAPARAQPAPAPEAGRAPPGWTGGGAERWAWGRALLREVADLGEHCRLVKGLDEREDLDPRDGDDPRWGHDCRQISAAFVERVLTEEPWRGALPRRGLRIVGARVAEPLDLSAARVGARVWLDGSRFEGPVDFQHARFEGVHSLSGSAFEAGVEAHGLGLM
jgi:hypothetical protein